MDHGEAGAKTRYYFCKNGPVSEFHLTEEDREEISSIPVPAEPRNPVFVNVMHPNHVCGTTRTSIVVSDLPSETQTKVADCSDKIYSTIMVNFVLKL